MVETPATTAQNRNHAPEVSDPRRDPRWWLTMHRAGVAPAAMLERWQDWVALRGAPQNAHEGTEEPQR